MRLKRDWTTGSKDFLASKASRALIALKPFINLKIVITIGKLAAQTATSAEEEFRKIRAEIAKVHLDFTKTGEQYVELSRQLGDAYRRLYETAQQMQRLNEYLPKRLSYDLPKPPRYSEIEAIGEEAAKAFGNRPSRALMKL